MIHINNKKKYIFIRTAKTGSTSLIQYLNFVDGHEPIILKEYPYDPNHINSDYIKNHYPEHFKNFFTFAFVRNPWSRMVSIWKMNMVYHPGTPDFKQYVKSIPTLEWMPDKGNHQKKPREVWLHKYSSIYEFTKGCDFIGRLENLQQDFNIVCEKIGIPHIKLPHKNKTEHEHYTEYYNDETKQIVAEKYAKDIEYFGYEFGE